MNREERERLKGRLQQVSVPTNPLPSLAMVAAIQVCDDRDAYRIRVSGRHFDAYEISGSYVEMHRRDGETARECVVRLVNERLINE